MEGRQNRSNKKRDYCHRIVRRVITKGIDTTSCSGEKKKRSRLTTMNIEERISKLQGFIDDISSLIVQHGEHHAIRGNLYLYQGFAIMIKELYELHADRKLLFTALTLALKTDQEKKADKAEIGELMNQLHDEIHRVDRDLKEIRMGVEDLKKHWETSQ
jgi:hypothetical protein